MGLSVVFCSVLAASLVILGSEAAEGAPFTSQIVLGTGIRLDLRRIMFRDRLFGVVLLHCKKTQSLGTLMGCRFHRRVGVARLPTPSPSMLCLVVSLFAIHLYPHMQESPSLTPPIPPFTSSLLKQHKHNYSPPSSPYSPSPSTCQSHTKSSATTFSITNT
jgi:hypothetical protein